MTDFHYGSTPSVGRSPAPLVTVEGSSSASRHGLLARRRLPSGRPPKDLGTSQDAIAKLITLTAPHRTFRDTTDDLSSSCSRRPLREPHHPVQPGHQRRESSCTVIAQVTNGNGKYRREATVVGKWTLHPNTRERRPALSNPMSKESGTNLRSQCRVPPFEKLRSRNQST